MAKPRFRDTFWIRISLMTHPAFMPGAPWNMAPGVFARLEGMGYVERRVYPNGAESAVGTDLARAHVDKIAERRIANGYEQPVELP